MGDLAPFVAAAIRDQVVQEQHERIESLEAKLQTTRDENRELRQELLYQQPVKQISLRDGLDRTKVYAEGEMNLLSFESSQPSPLSGCEDLFCSMDELLTMEIQVDGRRVARFADLECRSENFIYCDQTVEYVLSIAFFCPGLSVQVYLSPFPPSYHTQLTGLSEVPISPAALSETHTRFHCPIDPRRLLEFSNIGAQVKIPFDEEEFCCTREFVERSVGKTATFL